MDIGRLLESITKDVSEAKTIHDVAMVNAKYLGKKSLFAAEMAKLSSLEGSERSAMGRQLNELKQAALEIINARQSEIEESQSFSPIDISRPGISLSKQAQVGHMHPSSLVLKETYRVFTELGFAIVDSPEIEDDWHNFEALNMPDIHPAREMQDTFYIKDSSKKLLPRTHTSGMQIRFMEENEPPFKIIVPGKVFRNENEDATHSWIFGQIEGLVVGEGVSVTDLKGTLLQIVKKQLGTDTQVRFRASYFPYTEPSVEVDAKFNGKWLELGGAGMIHPEVLKKGGIDPDKYSGFAFGWGVERLGVIKYGINDLRQLWRPNFNYLEQF
jgi:phenylalanyl-tRNA synthetase alpha chain